MVQQNDGSMTRRGVIAMLAAGGSGALLLASCDFSSDVRYRYRMTVEVDTPQGLRSGSSVIEVTTGESSGVLGSNIRTRVRGEAVAVDLPDGQTLFALLSTQSQVDAAGGYAVAALMPERPDKGVDGTAWLNNMRALKTMTGSAELPEWREPIAPEKERQRMWPTLVRFHDIRDPKTVELVDPDNLSSAFGPDVKIRRIVLAITDDAVTMGIGRRLPHFGTGSGYLGWRQTLPNDDPRRRLTRSEFTTETGK